MQNESGSQESKLEQKKGVSPRVTQVMENSAKAFNEYQINAVELGLTACTSFLSTVAGLPKVFAVLFDVIDDQDKTVSSTQIRRANLLRKQYDYEVSFAIGLPSNAILKHNKFHYFKHEGVWSYIFLNKDDNPSDAEFKPTIKPLAELKGSGPILSKMDVDTFNPLARKAALEKLFRSQLLAEKEAFYSGAISDLSLELKKLKETFKEASSRVLQGENKAQVGKSALTDLAFVKTIAEFQFLLSHDKGCLHLIRSLMAAVDKLYTEDKIKAGLNERQVLQQTFHEQLQQITNFYDMLSQRLDTLCQKQNGVLSLLRAENADDEAIKAVQDRVKAVEAEKLKCEQASVFTHLLSLQKTQEEFDDLFRFYSTATPALIQTFASSGALAKKAGSLEKELIEVAKKSQETNRELNDIVMRWKVVDDVETKSDEEDELSENTSLLRKVVDAVETFEQNIKPVGPNDAFYQVRAANNLGNISLCWWLFPAASTGVGLGVAFKAIEATVFIGMITATPPGWAVALTATAVALTGFLIVGLVKLVALYRANREVALLLRNRLDTQYACDSLGAGVSSASLFKSSVSPTDMEEDNLLVGSDVERGALRRRTPANFG